MEDTTNHVIVKGAVGTISSLLATGVSLVSEIEQGLRVASLTLGCVVAIITIRSLLKGKKP